MSTKLIAAGGGIVLLAGATFAGLTAAPAPTLSTASDIQTAEDAYFTKNGAYIQVLPNDALAAYESGTVKSVLGTDMATTTRVNTYQTPTGEKGYEVQWSDATTDYSVGFGPEAALRTHNTPREIPGTPPPSSTSTTPTL